MAEYYRSVFSISQTDAGGARLLGSVRDAVREWVADDFGPRQLIDGESRKWTGGGGELSEIERRLDGESLATFRIKWERPDPDGEIERWRMSVRLATEGADVEADIEVRGSESGQPAPRPEYVAALPSIPHKILDEFNCRMDGRRMIAVAKRIDDDAEASAFVENDLLNPNRRLPLVVVSQNASARGAGADLLQGRLLGLARVVWYDHNTAWRIARDMPRALRCYDGAIRLYAPGCSEDDVAQQNPYWLLEVSLRLQNGGKLWMLLRDECVNRVPRHTRRRLFSSVSDRIDDAEREAERQRIEADFQAFVDLETEKQANQIDRADIDPEFYAAYVSLEDEYGEPPRYSAVAYRLVALVSQRKNKRLETENKELEREIERLKTCVCESGDDVKPTALTPDADPKNVLEAVAKADATFDTLRFFPTAFKHARDSQFRPAVKVYETFAVLNNCAKERAEGGLGKSVTSWLSERGVEYAPGESTPTSQKYIDDRIFGGVYMPAHVKMGGGDLRIHLRWEESEGKWLIGYVGKHLPTANFPD